MSIATEVASIPLKAGARFEDVNSHAGKVWASVIDIIARQPGFQRLYYGREIENDKNITLVVDVRTHLARPRCCYQHIADGTLRSGIRSKATRNLRNRQPMGRS